MMTYFNWMSRSVLCEDKAFKLRLKKGNCEKSQVMCSDRWNNTSKDSRVRKPSMYLRKLRKVNVTKAK